MKKIFNMINPPKPSSLEFHIISSAIMKWDNESGRECNPRYIYFSKLCETYMKNNRLSTTVYTTTPSNKNKQPMCVIMLCQRDKKGYIIKTKHYGSYQRYYMWNLTKEMEFYHSRFLYKIIWNTKYMFSNFLFNFKNNKL